MVCRGWHASARSDSHLQLSASLIRTDALAYRAIAHVQRLARPLLADDKQVQVKNKAWEIQKDMSASRLHETYKKLRMLGSHSSRRPLKTVKNGELTTTEAQRQQKWSEHFCSMAAGNLHWDPSSCSCSDEIVSISTIAVPVCCPLSS